MNERADPHGSAGRRAVQKRVAAVTRRQHSLITAPQARACGVSADRARRWLRQGVWTTIVPGVYAVSGAPTNWRQRTLAAVLAAGPGAAASHTTAAALFGLSSCPFRAVEITVPRGRSHRSRLAAVHESAFLGPSDITVIDGIPVTRPARTLVDLAGSVSRAVLEDAVDDALVRRLTTLARLERRAAALGGSGRSGSALLRGVLASWTVGEVAEEVAEMRLVRRLVAQGLPAPVLQYEIRDQGGHIVARADAAYPDDKVALELNGFRWHGTPRGYARDQARARRLAALGWLVLPATPVDLAGDGAALAEQVVSARRSVHAAKRGA